MEMTKGCVVLMGSIKKVAVSALSEIGNQIGVIEGNDNDLEIIKFRGAGKMGDIKVQMPQIQYMESNLPAYLLILANYSLIFSIT